MKTRTYSELIQIPTFKERYLYLQLKGKVGEVTFGFDRYLNQILYKTDRWSSIRDKVIIRDDGCDLGVEGYTIEGSIYIHHMNAITIEDIKSLSPNLFDLNNLICTSKRTHDAIHFGDESLLPSDPITRYSGDTCPWK